MGIVVGKYATQYILHRSSEHFHNDISFESFSPDFHWVLVVFSTNKFERSKPKNVKNQIIKLSEENSL